MLNSIGPDIEPCGTPLVTKRFVYSHSLVSVC